MTPRGRRSEPPPKGLGHVDDLSTGWSFDVYEDPGTGLFLSDVHHDGFAMAMSIGIERIGLASIDEGYRNPEDPANYQVLSLGDMERRVAPRLAEPSGMTGAELPLGHYLPRMTLRAEYAYTGAIHEPDQRIRIQPRFVFTPYSKDPSHEPGGTLRAARLYPMVRFVVEGNERRKADPTYRRVTGVQILFRLHVRVVEARAIFNQAGVFYDLDAAGKPGNALGLLPPRPGSLFFLRAEKPIPYEIAGRGLDRGYPADWDNIHQWASPVRPDAPAKEGLATRNQPPTPGLPYGFHTHWRWAESATTGGLGLKGGQQYAGPGGAGFPLIDPAVPDQTLEIAIVRADGRQDEVLRRIDRDPVMWLFRDFDLLWSDLGPPASTLPVADLVTWVSITASHPDRRSATGPSYRRTGARLTLDEWSGTLFSHGLFFAHEDWDVLPTILRHLPGVFSHQYLPDVPRRTWRRPP